MDAMDSSSFCHNMSDGDMTNESINFSGMETTQRVYRKDGTVEVTDSMPKKEYYMSLRRGPKGPGSTYDSSTLRTLNRSQGSLDFKPSGKTVETTVVMLDGTEEIFTIDKASSGQQVFDAVCDHLAITEKEFFGLTYKDASRVWYWLSMDKKIAKEIGNKGQWTFEFQVKFYPPTVNAFQDDLTRYYLSLQVRQDIVSGKLPCSFTTYVLLGSYVVQSEAGDHDPRQHFRTDYIKDQPFAPRQFQTTEMLERIVELHKLNKGQIPEVADKNFVENARKLALYGIDFHKCKDKSGEDVMVGVFHGGVVVYRGKLRIHKFSWPRIIKLSCKSKTFNLSVRPNEGPKKLENIMSFKCKDEKLAHRLLRACIDHHTFFRLRDWTPRKPNLLPSYAQRKYTLAPNADPSGGPRPQPRFKRMEANRRPSNDGWFSTLTLDGRPRGSRAQSMESNLNQYASDGQPQQFNRDYIRPRFDLEYWKMSSADCTHGIGMDAECLDVAAERNVGWQGCRSNRGVKAPGQFYYEGTLIEDGTVLLGWSTNDARLEMDPSDPQAFAQGFAGPTGRPMTNGNNGVGVSMENMIPIKLGDVVGCHVDLDGGKVQWSVNGQLMGPTKIIQEPLRTQGFFPAAALQDARVKFNFGDQAFQYYPVAPFVPASQSSDDNQVPNKFVGWRMNNYDTTKAIDIAPDGLASQSHMNKGWQGCRSNKGVHGGGKYYYEASPLEDRGVYRVGWSTPEGSLDLGSDLCGYGYGQDRDVSGPEGKLIYANTSNICGPLFAKDDIVGCLLDLDNCTLIWTKNGQQVSAAVAINPDLIDSTFFPTASMGNGTMEFNFGDKPFRYHPGNDWTPISYTPEGNTRWARKKGPERKSRGFSYIDPSALDESIKQKMMLNAQPYGGSHLGNNQDRPICPVSPVNGSGDQFQHLLHGYNNPNSPQNFNGQYTDAHLMAVSEDSHRERGHSGSSLAQLTIGEEAEEGTTDEVEDDQKNSALIQAVSPGAFSYFAGGLPPPLISPKPPLVSPRPINSAGPSPIFVQPSLVDISPSQVLRSNSTHQQQQTFFPQQTIERGEPEVETETYIDDQGNLVTRTIRRTKVVTKTMTNHTITERSENDIMTGHTGKLKVTKPMKHFIIEEEDEDDRLLTEAILAVTGMDPDVSVLNDSLGDVEIHTKK